MAVSTKSGSVALIGSAFLISVTPAGTRSEILETSGMTLAIEPMVNAGLPGVKILNDDWTVVTEDGSLSAHFEHTVLVTDGEPEILTWPEKVPSKLKVS